MLYTYIKKLSVALIVLRIICPPDMACHALGHARPLPWFFFAFFLKAYYCLIPSKELFLIKV